MAPYCYHYYCEFELSINDSQSGGRLKLFVWNYKNRERTCFFSVCLVFEVSIECRLANKIHHAKQTLVMKSGMRNFRFLPEFRFLCCSKDHFVNRVNPGRNVRGVGKGVWV